MKDIYNSGNYLELNPDWADDEAPFKFENLKRILRRNIPHILTDTKEIKILDIGYGSGGISSLVASSLYDDAHVTVIGYDVSKYAYDMACQKYGGRSNLKFMVGTIEDIPDHEFDLAICADVVEHVDNYRKFLSDLTKKAKFAYFNVPIEVNLLSILRPNVFENSYRSYGHLHFFNHEYFLFIVREMGFEVIDWDYSYAFKGIFKNKRAYMIFPLRVLFGLLSRKLSAALFGGYSLQVFVKRK